MKKAFQKLIDDLEKAGVNTDSFHWVTKTKQDKKKVEFIIQKFFKKYGPLRAGFSMRRYCNCRGCYNPFHYHQVVDEGEISEENFEEIEALMIMIDEKELLDMGFNRYFEFFNKDNPLPAKKLDFYIACNRKMRKLKLPTYGKEVLDGD